MNELGMYLRTQRVSQSLSLKDVYVKCGITDSKLSRIEHGERLPDPAELRKLASVYGLDVISLNIMAGYIDKKDLIGYQFVFQNAMLLNDEEKQSIQTQINLLTKGRTGLKNDF